MPTSSVDAAQVSATENGGRGGRETTGHGRRGAVGPRPETGRPEGRVVVQDVVAVAAAAVSPIWNCATGPASPRSTVAGRLPTGAPSSQTSSVEDDSIHSEVELERVPRAGARNGQAGVAGRTSAEEVVSEPDPAGARRKTSPIEAPVASFRRIRAAWLTPEFTKKATREYASADEVDSVFLANTGPTPSAAKLPVRTLAPSMVNPPLVVQAEKSPDSKPSAKTGAAAAGVVTGSAADCADGLPEVSRARTV